MAHAASAQLMKQVTSTLLILLLFMACSAAAEQNGTDDFTIILYDNPVTVRTGESVTASFHVDAPEGAKYSIGGEYENKHICTALLGSKKGNDISLVVTGRGSGVSKITVFHSRSPGNRSGHCRSCHHVAGRNRKSQ